MQAEFTMLELELNSDWSTRNLNALRFVYWKKMNLAKGLQAAASDWWLYRWFVKWKTIRTALTAKSCISNGINTCSRGNMQLKLFCLSLNRYGPSRRAWLMKLECLAMFNVCGKGRLRKWGTLYNDYNLAMDELRTPRDVDIVQSVLQYLEEHEQRTHPAGTRFVIHDTLCMCASSAAITMVTLLSLTPSVLRKRGGPVVLVTVMCWSISLHTGLHVCLSV